MEQWDAIGKKFVRVGQRRWSVEWETFVDEQSLEAARDCLEDWHYQTNVRHFPTSPLAFAFARRVSDPLMVWSPRIQEQRFDPNEYGPGGGAWNGVSEWCDV